MLNNISRAKGIIQEYALCNDWEYFITLTIDKEKMDRYNLREYIIKLGKFLNNKRYRKMIKFLLIPEKHKDGAWHMHGLIKGIPKGELKRNRNNYLDWQQYSIIFGYCSLSPIRDELKVANYILKYVGKGMHERVKGEHLYYCSSKLKRAVRISEGFMKKEPEKWDYENDFVKILWIENDDIELIGVK